MVQQERALQKPIFYEHYSETDELEYDNHSEQDVEINDDERLKRISEENVFEGEEDNITEKKTPSTSKEDNPQDMTKTISVGDFVIFKVETNKEGQDGYQ